MYTVVEETIDEKNSHYNSVPEIDGKKVWFRIQCPNGKLSFSAYLTRTAAEKVCFKKNSEIPCTQG